jgi:hypothetical protein
VSNAENLPQKGELPSVRLVAEGNTTVEFAVTDTGMVSLKKNRYYI